jgi:hypothetical protein
MDPPMPELHGGQQEQELRQLLNKDKSKRSKDEASWKEGSGRVTICWDALCLPGK